MRISLHVVRVLAFIFIFSTGASLYADWNQWAHDPQHTGYVADVTGQSLAVKRWSITIDNSIAPSGDLLVHYASPIIDSTNTIFMTEKEKIGTVIHRRVMKLNAAGTVLCKYETDYVPPPSSWEPVLHPLLVNGYLYVPGARGILRIVDSNDCSEVGYLAPYELPEDPAQLQQLLTTAFVGGLPTLDDSGNIYYPFLVRGTPPLGLKSRFVMIDAKGNINSATYDDLVGQTGARPALNSGAAIGPDGTIYTGAVKPGFSNEGYLLALNPDLSLKWRGDMSADPARKALIIDQSSSCPVVGPDGKVFYGGWNGNGLSQGYLYAFSAAGAYLNNFEFGWDTTPAIYPDPDGDPNHYHLVQKYNKYLEQRYFMVSLNPNTMAIECQWELVGREWCINAPAIDADGAIYTNGEDGYLYRMTGMYPGTDGMCAPQVTRIELERARDAAYTPLALGPDGTIYTLNNGSLFAVGDAANE